FPSARRSEGTYPGVGRRGTPRTTGGLPQRSLLPACPVAASVIPVALSSVRTQKRRTSCRRPQRWRRRAATLVPIVETLETDSYSCANLIPLSWAQGRGAVLSSAPRLALPVEIIRQGCVGRTIPGS